MRWAIRYSAGSQSAAGVRCVGQLGHVVFRLELDGLEEPERSARTHRLRIVEAALLRLLRRAGRWSRQLGRRRHDRRNVGTRDRPALSGRAAEYAPLCSAASRLSSARRTDCRKQQRSSQQCILRPAAARPAARCCRQKTVQTPRCCRMPPARRPAWQTDLRQRAGQRLAVIAGKLRAALLKGPARLPHLLRSGPTRRSSRAPS